MRFSSSFSISLLVLFLSAGAAHALPPEVQEKLAKGLRDQAAVFEKIPPPAEGKPKPFEIELGDKIAEIQFDQQEQFDGIRFTYPKKAEGKDFVWYFNAPEGWGNWYILPMEGGTEGGFKSWLDADMLYRGLDQANEKGRSRILQTLEAGYFKPGQEYLLWFRHANGDPKGKARVVMTFAKPPEDRDGKAGKWDHEAIEKALQLDHAPLADQVVQLNSRGGMILLDETLFAPSDAKSRIESVFSEIRATRRSSDGVFITMKQSVPPCASRLSIEDIRKKYGEPDLIRSSREEAEAWAASGEKQDDSEEKDGDHEDATIYYYDHFGFKVNNESKDGMVVQVLTQAESFASMAPPKEGNSWAFMEMERLTVFHQDGKEVGRAYNFPGSTEDMPVFVKIPPTGVYKNEHGVLTSEGDGAWTWDRLDEHGKLEVRFKLKNNVFEGEAIGYYPDTGAKRASLPYKAGKLDGDLILYSADGKEEARRKFKDGQEQE